MVILNSDGSPYQLIKPNPFLKSQDMSDDEMHIIHNFGVDEVTVKYVKKKTVTTTFPATIGKADLPPPLPEQPKIKPVLTKEPLPVIEEEIQEEEVQTVACWCLPYEWKKHYDKLYGEIRTAAVPGDQFRFGGVVLSLDETAYQIWAKVEIKPPSVIFIGEDRRWWRVVSVEAEGGGHTMTCMPSDIRPRFD